MGCMTASTAQGFIMASGACGDRTEAVFYALRRGWLVRSGGLIVNSSPCTGATHRCKGCESPIVNAAAFSRAAKDQVKAAEETIKAGQARHPYCTTMGSPPGTIPLPGPFPPSKPGQPGEQRTLVLFRIVCTASPETQHTVWLTQKGPRAPLLCGVACGRMVGSYLIHLFRRYLS